MAFKFPDKDPDERLDYTVDWSRYLTPENLTISSVVWKIEKADGSAITFTEDFSFQADALVANSVSTVGLTNALVVTPTNTTTTIVLDKGEANKTYTLICEITTSVSSKTTDRITTNRKIKVKVRERI